MKLHPSCVVLAALSTLGLSSVAQAQSSRESERLLRRQSLSQNPQTDQADQPSTPTEEPVPAETPAVVETPVADERPVAETVPVLVPEAVPPVVPTIPAADLAALQSEVERDANSYRNENYSFELNEKGFLRRLALADGTVVLDSTGAVNLQGSYLTPEGRRVWFYAGGVGNSTYTSTSTKTVRDGRVVFDVTVNHPRFSMTATYACLPHAIDAEVRFTPIRMTDQRGDIQAIYALQLWPASLEQGATKNGDGVSYATKQGPLLVSFDKANWPEADLSIRRAVRVGDTGLAFNFSKSTEPEEGSLSYTIRLP